MTKAAMIKAGALLAFLGFLTACGAMQTAGLDQDYPMGNTSEYRR